MRRVAIVLCATLAGAAQAGEWSPLDGAAIRTALTERILGYANGAVQAFHASGGTDYDSGGFAPGRWRVEGDRYCSQWPPSDRWTCYGVERSPDGRGLRFIAQDGSATEGRYVDGR